MSTEISLVLYNLNITAVKTITQREVQKEKLCA